MDIAIIGTGSIATALAGHWARAGHVITFGTRHPDDPTAQQLAARLGAELTTPEIAVTRGQAVTYAIPGDQVVPTLDSHAPLLDGRTVVIPANDVHSAHPNLARAAADAAPGALVVRASNTIAAETLVAGSLHGRSVDMFYVSDAHIEEVAEQLIVDCGLRPIRLGDLDQGHLTDQLLSLWAALAFGQHAAATSPSR